MESIKSQIQKLQQTKAGLKEPEHIEAIEKKIQILKSRETVLK